MNIVVVIADDHARWATGLYGPAQIRTPNIDQLAAQGVVFDNAMAVSPVCSPARASFYTGKIPSAHGIHDFLSETPAFDAGWLQGEKRLAERLQSLGYATALLGKWHATTDSFAPQPGFDRWLSYDPLHAGWQNQYTHDGTVSFSDNGERLDHTGVQAEFLTEAAIEFIDQYPTTPFFINLNFAEPHDPYAGLPERLVQPYRDDLPRLPGSDLVADLPAYRAANSVPDDHEEQLAQYLAAVTLIDEQIGRLLDALDARGLMERTVFVYTSDHGLLLGQQGLYGKANATRPPNFYEPTIRVPMLVRTPGQSGARRSEFVDLIDLQATVLDYASQGDIVSVPDSPGRSMRPLIEGEPIGRWRSVQFAERGNARMVTDGSIKLVRYYPRDPAREPVDHWYAVKDGFDHRLEHAPGDGESLVSGLEAHFQRYETPEHTGRLWHRQPPPNARVAREAEEPDPF